MRRGHLFFWAFFLLIALFPFVSAGFLSGVLGNFGITSEHGIIIKYCFSALVLIIIFYILQKSRFPQNGLLRFFISLVIGFLATAFLSPAEAYGLFNEYVALVLAVVVAVIIFVGVMVYKKIRGNKYRF